MHRHAKYFRANKRTIGTLLPRLMPVLLAMSLVTTSALAKKPRNKRIRGKEVCALFTDAPVRAILGNKLKTIPGRYTGSCAYERLVTKKKDAAAEAAFSKQIMKNLAAQLRGEKIKFTPPAHSTDRVSVTFQGDQKSSAAAAARMKSMRQAMQRGITVSTSGSRNAGFKSKVKIGDDAERATAPDEDAASKEMLDDVNRNLAKGEKTIGRPLPGGDKKTSASMSIQSKVEILHADGIDEAHYLVKFRNVTARKGKRIITVEVRLGKTPDEEKELALALAQEWLR